MIKYILSSIKKNRVVFILMTLVFFVISTVVPLSVSALYTSKVMAKDDITKYGRGEYDILVRPESGIMDTEKKFKLVEENYLASGTGGISIRQYNDIKSIENIEVAAPVSTLGYFQSNVGAITIEKPLSKSYHVKYDFYTYDGARDYPIGSREIYQIASNFIDKEKKQVLLSHSCLHTLEA